MGWKDKINAFADDVYDFFDVGQHQTWELRIGERKLRIVLEKDKKEWIILGIEKGEYVHPPPFRLKVYYTTTDCVCIENEGQKKLLIPVDLDPREYTFVNVIRQPYTI